jgi:epoxyqueuosine reductase QueG
VCPFNRPAPVSADPAWQPRPGLDLPRLVELASRSDDDLRTTITGSAMTRAHVSGLRRNIDAALVNLTT